MKAFQATEVFLKTDHLKVVASFPLNKIAVLEIVCLKVVVTFESCRCGACWCITGKLCQTPYWRLLLMEKVDDMRAMRMLQLNAGDSIVPPTTVTGSTTTGLLGYATPFLYSKTCRLWIWSVFKVIYVGVGQVFSKFIGFQTPVWRSCESSVWKQLYI